MAYEVKGIVCATCGHKWIPRVENPLKCPRCQSFNYRGKDKEVKPENDQ